MAALLALELHVPRLDDVDGDVDNVADGGSDNVADENGNGHCDDVDGADPGADADDDTDDAHDENDAGNISQLVYGGGRRPCS